MKSSDLLEKRLRYHELEMSSDSDISSNIIPSQKYCIASTPRSGSTLLSRMLFATGMAGNPKEYLNPLLMQAWSRVNNKPLLLHDYLDDIKSKRTSINGIFGMKVHWRHLEKLREKKVPIQDIHLIMNEFDKYIFISRKDKISQAISYYIASSTGIFHSDQEEWLSEFEIHQPAFKAEYILRHLADIVREEDGWHKFFEETQKPTLRVWFEDLISDYESKSKEIISFLDLPSTMVPLKPTREMQKNASLNYKELLLESVGIRNYE